MANLERKLADIAQSNQDFLNTALQKVHGTLLVKFKRFVEEQIRAIEDTKVKIKKRKGVISFMRVFPPFSAAVENMLATVEPGLGIRRTVDGEYERILKSMFDSLKVIARENPSATVAATTSDGSREACEGAATDSTLPNQSSGHACCSTPCADSCTDYSATAR